LMSFGLTFLYRKWAVKRSILDFPNERSSHLTPTPRGGGVAIVISFYLSLIILFLTDHIENKLFYALIPGLALAIIGSIDDIRQISPAKRLIVHFLCSGFAIFWLGGFKISYIEHMNWLWSVILLFGFVWFINLFNFLDGSDGYASMETILVSLALWYLTKMNVFFILCLSAAGFLYWNWPKAKIFMGDSGSTTLGYILIVLGTYLHNTMTLDFSYWLILTSLFWFDASVTLFRRLIHMERLSQAHKKHVYERAINGGFSHLNILITGILINASLFVVCISVLKDHFSLLTGSVITLLILLVPLKYIDRKFPS